MSEKIFKSLHVDFEKAAIAISSNFVKPTEVSIKDAIRLTLIQLYSNGHIGLRQIRGLTRSLQDDVEMEW